MNDFKSSENNIKVEKVENTSVSTLENSFAPECCQENVDGSSYNSFSNIIEDHMDANNYGKVGGCKGMMLGGSTLDSRVAEGHSHPFSRTSENFEFKATSPAVVASPGQTWNTSQTSFESACRFRGEDPSGEKRQESGKGGRRQKNISSLCLRKKREGRVLYSRSTRVRLLRGQEREN